MFGMTACSYNYALKFRMIGLSVLCRKQAFNFSPVVTVFNDLCVALAIFLAIFYL